MQIQKMILLALLAFVTSHLNAQKAKSAVERDDVGGNDLIEMYRTVYETSLKYNDLSVATQASYALIALEPGNMNRLDTLARIYFQRSAFAQAIMVARDVLASQPENKEMLEITAFSKQSLGASKEALDDYEALYKLSGDPYHLYEIATLQYTMRRFGECEANITRLLAMPEIADKTMTISYNKVNQQVPFPAALHNLYGVLHLDQGKEEIAIKHFQQALDLAPEFYLAKANLEALQNK